MRLRELQITTGQQMSKERQSVPSKRGIRQRREIAFRE